MQRIRTRAGALAPVAAVALAAAGAFTAVPALADSVVTAPLSVQGMFTNFGQNNGAYHAGAGNVLVGQQTAYGYIGFHNYFVFDLSSLPAGSATVTSATLSLTLPYNALISPSPSETWTLYDVSDSSVPTLHDQGAWLEYGVYDDLASGQAYGSREFTTADNQTTITLDLNAAALRDITSHLGSEFAIGGALTTLGDSSATQELFAFSGYDTNTTLKLTLGPAAAVPLPNAAQAGLALLAPIPFLRRYRRRLNAA